MTTNCFIASRSSIGHLSTIPSVHPGLPLTPPFSEYSQMCICALHLCPQTVRSNASPSPLLTMYPMTYGSSRHGPSDRYIRGGHRLLSPLRGTKIGSASLRHLHPRVNVNKDKMNPRTDMPTVIHVCAVSPRNVICARSTPINSSFLRHLRRLVFVRFPAYASGGRNLNVNPLLAKQMHRWR